MKFRRISSRMFVTSIIFIILFTMTQGVGYTPQPTAVNTPMEGVMVLMLLDNQYDGAEYQGAKNKLESFGCTIVHTATTAQVESFQGGMITVDVLFEEVDEDDYDCVYIPGGLAPDNLIAKPAVISFIQRANDKGLALAAICSGPLVFAAAGIVDGKNVTGNISVQKELVEAGGNYLALPCVRDGNLITADNPYMDLSCYEIAKYLGYYEEDPPEVGEVNYTINRVGTTYDCCLGIEITDYFGVQQVRATAYKYENNRTEKKLTKQVLLTDPDNDEIFNYTIADLESGEYCITLFVQDVLGNEYTNESFLELDLTATENSTTGIIAVSGFSVMFLALYARRRKNNK